MKSLLVDTNIFLEILLNQDKKEECKIFLTANAHKLAMSDFSLHSIGVILMNQKKQYVFEKFITDTLPNIDLLMLPRDKYQELSTISSDNGLDFDDAYQTCLSINNNLEIVTMDKDFKKVKKITTIRFL
jgi:uncharacterized protein